MTTYRYYSRSFQYGNMGGVVEDLNVYLSDSPVLRRASVRSDASTKMLEIEAEVCANGVGPAVIMAFAAADEEWRCALDVVGARKHICNSSLVVA